MDRKVFAVFVVMFLMFGSVAVATPALADTSSDMANLTASLNTLLLAIIPLIIMIGIFGYVLAKVKFK